MPWGWKKLLCRLLCVLNHKLQFYIYSTTVLKQNSAWSPKTKDTALEVKLCGAKFDGGYQRIFEGRASKQLLALGVKS